MNRRSYFCHIFRRADELQKHQHLVAYYCRLYAMERGLKIPQSARTKTTSALLVSLMNQLEKDKNSLQLGPDDNLHVEGFALDVFAKADKQDRAGRADLNTAKTFYAASIFFEILNQFGVLQPDLEQKQKYAAWKAADIRKALKEGRKPLPGPPGGDQDFSVQSSTASGEYDLEPNRGDFAIRPDPSGVDPTARTVSDTDPPPQPYDQDNFQHPTNISQKPSSIPSSPSVSISPPPHYPNDEYPSDGLHQHPSTNNYDHFVHHPSYHNQPYHPEPHQQFPQHHPSRDAPSYSYPNFQSYPGFTESSLPTVPSHYPTNFQGPDASYANSSPSNAGGYPSSAQYNSSGGNGCLPQASPPSAVQKCEYDSSYQPPPEKIAEAHKAARFAVGALAFDDVSIAVEHLKKSLELLTNPAAGH